MFRWVTFAPQDALSGIVPGMAILRTKDNCRAYRTPNSAVFQDIERTVNIRSGKGTDVYSTIAPHGPLKRGGGYNTVQDI